MKKTTESQSPVTIAFFLAAVYVPPSFILAIFVWQNPTFIEYLYIFFVVATTILGYIALAKAFKAASLTVLMPFEYSSLIFAAIFSYMVFGDVVKINVLFGGAIILLSVCMIVIVEHRKAQNKEELEIL